MQLVEAKVYGCPAAARAQVGGDLTGKFVVAQVEDLEAGEVHGDVPIEAVVSQVENSEERQVANSRREDATEPLGGQV